MKRSKKVEKQKSRHIEKKKSRKVVMQISRKVEVLGKQNSKKVENQTSNEDRIWDNCLSVTTSIITTMKGSWLKIKKNIHMQIPVLKCGI